MSLSPRRDQQRQFWLRIRAGKLREEAATDIGVHSATGERWFSQAGGVIPAYVRTAYSGRYLTLAEREDIFAGVERGESIRFIAKGLGRAPSTVLRELRRNMRHRYRTQGLLRPHGGLRRTLPWDYRPSLAQQRADAMAVRPKQAKLATNLLLRELVEAKLKEQLSPEQISAQLRRQYPNDTEMWVSHEAIYQSIYVQGRGALRRELAVCLRTGRALRRPHRKGNERRAPIPDMVNISQRPAEVEDRAIPGHWEGDLIMGKYGRSAIGTLVERSTRFVMLLHLPDGHSPAQVEQAIIGATHKLPDFVWKSLTWDQGNELRNHLQIKVATGLQVFFCDLSSSWERASNENTNGLLRQYFPKGTDLSQHGPDYLEFVAAQMNRRPRKTLGWRRPAEALGRLLSTTSEQAGVALTD